MIASTGMATSERAVPGAGVVGSAEQTHLGPGDVRLYRAIEAVDGVELLTRSAQCLEGLGQHRAVVVGADRQADRLLVLTGVVELPHLPRATSRSWRNCPARRPTSAPSPVRVASSRA